MWDDDADLHLESTDLSAIIGADEMLRGVVDDVWDEE